MVKGYKSVTLKVGYYCTGMKTNTGESMCTLCLTHTLHSTLTHTLFKQFLPGKARTTNV